MEFQHATQAAGKWFELSLFEQLGNVGSEVGRARKWQNKNQKVFENCFARAHELLMLTIADPRWIEQAGELCRVKEVLCDAYCGGALYNSDFVSLEKYFNHFAVAAQKRKLVHNL